MKSIRVKVKEIKPDPESEGCFRLVLADLEGGVEVPVTISEWDARPLAEELEGSRSFRPRTHDLFVRFIEAAGYRLLRVNIHTFRRGVFYASLEFVHPEKEGIELDSRPTDAIALALRTGADIYVNNEIIRQVGVLLSNDTGSMKLSQRLKVMEEKLRQLVEEERYEEAGILRDRIKVLKEDLA